jgi:hypothetical protein
MSRGKPEAVGKTKLRDIISLRSAGHTISETAWRLGLYPWVVAYVSRFVRMCVSSEEMQFLEEESQRHKFGTVGEFVMDVFNRCYEDYYAEALKKKKVG